MHLQSLITCGAYGNEEFVGCIVFGLCSELCPEVFVYVTISTKIFMLYILHMGEIANAYAAYTQLLVGEGWNIGSCC